MGTKDALLAGTAANPPTDGADDEKRALFGDMSDEQLADMTDEERAGIDGGGDDDGDGDGDDTNGDDADGEDDDEGSDNDDGEGKKEAEEDEDGDDGDGGSDEDDADGADGDKVADTGVEDGATGDNATDGDDEEDDLDITRSVLPQEWQLPKDSEDKLKALTDQIGELADKFDAGDLTAREYHQQQQTLADQRFSLQSQINDAQKSFNKAMADWSNRTVKGFLREHKQYASNETLNRMLDGEVRALQQTTNDPFNPRILRKAHANIQAALGQAPEPKGDGKKDGKKDKTPVVAGKRPQVPPTLARVPQDEIEDAEGGKFSRLERLEKRDAHAFEEAFSRLSDADKDAYLAGA